MLVVSENRTGGTSFFFFGKAGLARVGNLFHHLHSSLSKMEMILRKWNCSVLSEAEVSLRSREMWYKIGRDWGVAPRRKIWMWFGQSWTLENGQRTSDSNLLLTNTVCKNGPRHVDISLSRGQIRYSALAHWKPIIPILYYIWDLYYLTLQPQFANLYKICLCAWGEKWAFLSGSGCK